VPKVKYLIPESKSDAEGNEKCTMALAKAKRYTFIANNSVLNLNRLPKVRYLIPESKK
jgi:hypothetical protein